MARGINEIELVGLAIPGLVIQGDTLCLDRDTALALDIHGIEHLLLHLTIGQTTAGLDKAVSQRRFAVIDMGNDGEISDVLEVAHAIGPDKVTGRPEQVAQKTRDCTSSGPPPLLLEA
ncbi:hypothetical protein GCM10007052_13710 [Halioglobus japonicus]|nr:hypothetical protein GCM10007052_13710 [Halioglobus japonicus]